MNSVIKNISFVKEWNNPKGGIIYYHDIEFENGDKGQIGAKTKLPDKLAVGKSLDYEKTTSDNGQVRIKAIQVQQQFGSKLSPEQEERKQRMIIAQNCMSNAAHYYAKRSTGGMVELIAMANDMYSWVMTKADEK